MTNLKTYNNVFLFFLFFIIGFSSVSYSLINNLVITFILGVALLFVLLKYKLEYFNFEKKRSLFYFFLLFLVFGVSLYLSPYKNEHMLYRYFGVVLSIIFGIFGYFNYKNKGFDLICISQILSLIGFLHCTVLIFYWFSVPSPADYDWIWDMPFFSNIRHIADYLSICFLASFILLLNKKLKLGFIYYIFSVVLLSVIIWTGARAAYLSVALALIFLVLNDIKTIKKLIMVLVPSVILPLFFKTNLPGLGMGRSFDVVGKSVNSYTSGRVELYQMILSKFSESPLWGLGPEAVRNIAVPFAGGVFAHAHNLILQILIEFGFIGFILVSIIFVKPLICIAKFEKNYEFIILTSFVINIFIAAMFNGGFYYIVTLHIFCFFYGALLANLDSKSTITIS
ncbi:O-antigen ligase family protein [Acinetobacter sp. YH12239]|uniref:O-antigen ligase family protein n=1 Tax=Acinetobacter sp. YH12239 TaxID=2601166 RepID=UPI0015D13B07